MSIRVRVRACVCVSSQNKCICGLLRSLNQECGSGAEEDDEGFNNTSFVSSRLLHHNVWTGAKNQNWAWLSRIDCSICRRNDVFIMLYDKADLRILQPSSCWDLSISYRRNLVSPTCVFLAMAAFNYVVGSIKHEWSVCDGKSCSHPKQSLDFKPYRISCKIVVNPAFQASPSSSV